VVELCEQYGIALSEEAVRRSVKSTVNAILKNQGIKLDDLGKEVIAMTSCINRVFDTGSTLLLSIGLEQPLPQLAGHNTGAVKAIPSMVDAVLVFPRGVGPGYAANIAYMFCGDKFCKWNLHTNSVTAGQRSIRDGWTGYPYDKVDATIMYPPGIGPAYAKDAAYLFHDDVYLKWDMKSDQLMAGARNIKDGWPGYPFDRCDATLVYPPGVGPEDCQHIAFMFCGDQYCKWDLVTDSLKVGTKLIKDGFPGYSFA
jgi:hypothetical protein